jgi:hypothetical protein
MKFSTKDTLKTLSSAVRVQPIYTCFGNNPVQIDTCEEVMNFLKNSLHPKKALTKLVPNLTIGKGRSGVHREV